MEINKPSAKAKNYKKFAPHLKVAVLELLDLFEKNLAKLIRDINETKVINT